MPRPGQHGTNRGARCHRHLSWFEGYCRIGKMYKAKAVYVQAHCGTKDVPVTLDAQGDRLRVTWDRKVEDMKRCD